VGGVLEPSMLGAASGIGVPPSGIVPPSDIGASLLGIGAPPMFIPAWC